MIALKKISRATLLKIFLTVVVVSVSQTIEAQLYFPNESFYNSEIERLNLSKDSTDFYQNHLTVKPILDKKTEANQIYKSEGKYYYWITQKLFKENFLIFKGDDFWVSVDPIIDLQLGTDFSEDSLRRLYWNTRGIRVQAKFYDKIAFTTSVYENQAMVPVYQSDFFNARGEYFPVNTWYKQQNAFVPMYARTKPFKGNGYDFAFATGQLSIVPTKWFNLQLGNGNQFIGDGYRSLFLSDFSGNYPFLKTEFFAFKGRLQFNSIYSMLTNPYRLKYFNTPEATYERKIGAFHYLEYALTKRLNIGLFQGSLYPSTDSTGTQKVGFSFLNPFVGVNALFGFNMSYRVPKFLGIKSKVYAQLLFTDNSASASQIGIKLYDVLLPKLDLRIEYNHIGKNTYLDENVRYNYIHNNLALGHPLGPATKELVWIVNYEFKRFFVSNRITFYTKTVNDFSNIGADLLQPKSIYDYASSKHPNVFNSRFEMGYRMNKNYNLQIVLGYLYRKEIVENISNTTNYVYFGIRTKLMNKTLDW